MIFKSEGLALLAQSQGERELERPLLSIQVQEIEPDGMVRVQLSIQLPNAPFKDLGTRQATACQLGVIACVGGCGHKSNTVDAGSGGHTYSGKR